MLKRILFFLVIFMTLQQISHAQYWYYRGPRMRTRVRVAPPRRPAPQRNRVVQPYTPSLNINLGYGFPNLDKDQLADFYNTYRGNVSSQTGPVNASIDYRFSRNVSIGLLGTYGKVSAPYYDFNNNSTAPDFTGSLENWSLMLNLQTYFPTRTNKVEPYLKTAIGINNWTKDYHYTTGEKILNVPEPSGLAYQVALGSRFALSKNSGLFLEGGYGKYIINGGLTFKF